MQPTFVLVDDELFDAHRSNSVHPERPERLQALRTTTAAITARHPCALLPSRDATHEELARVHTESYIQQLDQAAGLSGHFDADTYYAPGSIAAAQRAAGGAIAIADQLASGQARLGVALVRPPGHHATNDRAMGFCLINNVAVAAAHARTLGLERIAIVDWDVHHGNGTEAIFYSDPHVLYVSLHQAPFYPGTGAASDCGAGEGRGFTVNVPLSANADRAVYLAAADRIVAPILEQYAPELLLISAGFDAHFRDPLAAMQLQDATYGELYDRLYRALPARGSGAARPGVGLILEGGYDLRALAGSLEATLTAALEGSDGGPASAADVGVPASTLAPAHARDLERALAAQRPFWLLD